MVDMDMIYIDLIQTYIILFVMILVPLFYSYIKKRLKEQIINIAIILFLKKKIAFMFLKEKEENVNLG